MAAQDAPVAMKACPFCKKQIRAVAVKCRYCERYLDGRKDESDDESGGVERMLMPVGRPLSAIAAGYLALFGIIPLIGLPFSIGAVICGVVARQAIRKNPKLSGIGRAWFGMIVGGVMTSIGLLLLIVLLLGSH